ncbi:hypothetical protein CDL12_04085 [Handroanthus impetiginosus]|uniref:Uncharacterized protein n=1 Tax=Handroanthus impetiginosus TaxID=429701 RepID=A0A2G9I0F0_9LAMI|nr:hypothetical protein CDL12_04085 [Handroanthus impetiginosus]
MKKKEMIGTSSQEYRFSTLSAKNKASIVIDILWLNNLEVAKYTTETESATAHRFEADDFFAALCIAYTKKLVGSTRKQI